MSNTQTLTCSNCAISDQEAPLVSLRFQGQEEWICTQCLPQLIHQPQQLVGKLSKVAAAPSDE